MFLVGIIGLAQTGKPAGKKMGGQKMIASKMVARSARFFALIPLPQIFLPSEMEDRSSRAGVEGFEQKVAKIAKMKNSFAPFAHFCSNRVFCRYYRPGTNG